MSIFSAFGKALKSVFHAFRKETREQIEKEARRLKPELKSGIDERYVSTDYRAVLLRLISGLRKVRLRLRQTRSI